MNMKWLLWKDYRQNRLIVFIGLALLFGPYVIGLGVFCGGRLDHEWNAQRPYRLLGAARTRNSLGRELVRTCSFAVDHRIRWWKFHSGRVADRSAEFLYALPIARRRLLASKLLFALVIGAVIWLVAGAVVGGLVIGARQPVPPERVWDFFIGAMAIGMMIGITSLTFFCVAWFLSSFVISPALDVCGGLITPVLVGTTLGIVDAALRGSGLSQEGLGLAVEHGGRASFAVPVFVWCYCAVCFVIAVVCFGVGTWHYLRRVEP